MSDAGRQRPDGGVRQGCAVTGSDVVEGFGWRLAVDLRDFIPQHETRNLADEHFIGRESC
ncbi:hypothetical protein [Burkholderia sp. ABCPW 14]|uniref:hypothetical protein n=1 Tax=Burkholderia sp. ABCPW 14 TaxID=1637860 RepID=UPI0012E39BC5|nr:hypothetical protein [Burkholderia sp. ABCPW 14]